MISDADLPELASFRKAEARSRLQASDRYGDLVVASNNDRSPVHRWFRFKESFSADLLRVLLDDLKPARREIRLLDPFCGVGTSLIAAQELRAANYNITATGIERNPFIGFVARTKVNWPQIDNELLRATSPHK